MEDQAREVLAVEGLEMDQEQGQEVPEEDPDLDQDREALVGEELEKVQGLAEEGQEGEGLEMDQERDEGDPVEVGLEITGLECFALNMPKIQNLSIHRKHGRKDTREKFCCEWRFFRMATSDRSR